MADEELYYVAEKSAKWASNKINDIFVSQYETQLDNMFGRAHQLDSGNNCIKVEFDDVDAFNRFNEEMKVRGVENVVVSSSTANNKYAVRIPKSNKAYAIQDEKLGGISGNVDESQKIDISGNKLIKDFEKRTNEKPDITIETPSTNTDKYNPDDYIRIAFDDKGAFERFNYEMNILGVEGVALSPIKLNGQYIAEVPKTSQAFAVKDASVGAESGNIDLSQKVSISGYDLISNFRDHTQDKTVDIKNLHPSEDAEAPMTEAKIISTFTSHMDEVGAIVGTVIENKNVRKSYGMDSNDEIFTRQTKDGNAYFSSGRAETAIVLANSIVIENGVVVEGKEREQILKQHQQRQSRAESETKAASTRKKDWTTQQKIRRENSQQIQDGIYRQSYASSRFDKSTASRTGGVLDKMVNDFNTEATALGLASASIVTLTEKEQEFLSKAIAMGAVDRISAEKINRIIADGGQFASYGDRLYVQQALERIQSLNDDGKINLKQEDQQVLKTLSSSTRGIKLLDEQLAMFTSAKATIEALKNDLGLDFGKTGIGRKDILEINKSFLKKAEAAGYQFVKRNRRGQLVVDTDALRTLTDSQLKELGISKKTRDVIATFNEKGAWGGKNTQNHSFLELMISGFLRVYDDAELTQTIGTMRKVAAVPYHVKNVATTANQLEKAAQAKVNEIRVRSAARKGKEIPIKTPPPKKETKAFVQSRKVNPELNEKWIKKDEKRLKRLSRSEKGVGAKLRKISNNFKKAKSKLLGSLIKYAAAGLGILTIIAAGLCIIIIIITTIQSFLSAPAKIIDGMLAPSDYTETVAFDLYQYLSVEEECWVDSVGDFDNLFKHKEEARYGIDYKDYSAYIADNPALIEREGKLYINPLAPAVRKGKISKNSIPTEALVEAKSFDGVLSTEFNANASKYSCLMDGSGNYSLDKYGNKIPVDNGHTSNIKDIISMIDVMYEFDMDAASDDGLSGLLGASPYQIAWRDFVNKFVGTIKWAFHNAGVFVKNFFVNAQEKYAARSEWLGDTCSYKTIRTYATQLFETSHQNQYNLSVKYYRDAFDDEYVPSGISQEEASKLGISVKKTKKKYKLYYRVSGNRIFVGVKTASGTVIDMSDSLLVENVLLYDDVPNPCLWYGMASNKETYDKVKSHDCWDSTKTSEKSQATVMTGWYDTAQKAKDAAMSMLETKYRAVVLGKDSYILSTDRNTFTAVQNVLNTYWRNSVQHDIITKTEGGGTGYKYTGVLKSYVVPSYCDPADYPDDTPEKAYKSGVELQKMTTYVYPSTVTRTISILEAVVDTNAQKVYYSDIATATFYTTEYDTLKRNCKGHEFEFDGGHICVESKGITYSTTNEQLALTDAYPSEYMSPVAKDFNVFEEYGQLTGKHNRPDSQVDYTSDYSAAHTGGSLAGGIDPQGSDVAQRGLNLYAYVDGRPLQSGVHIQDAASDSEDDRAIALRKFLWLTKDIFDIDCILDKGNNIFPWGADYKKYEGWSEDNVVMVCAKVSQDWTDIYGFDIPYELEGNLSNDDEAIRMDSEVKTSALWLEDINAIIDALKVSYGTSFTPAREESARLALSWVGRGHYSDDSSFDAASTPNFLSKQTIYKVTSSSAGGNPVGTLWHATRTSANSYGFVKFLASAQKDFSPDNAGRENFFWTPCSNIYALRPADFMWHVGNRQNAIIVDNRDNLVDALCEYRQGRYVFYLGILNQDVTLKCNRVLKAGQPLTIDLNRKGVDNLGVVRLNSNTPTSWDTYVDDPLSNYYWVEHPNAGGMVYYSSCIGG